MTDGVFAPVAAEPACDSPPMFLPARPINPADLAALTERVRRRVIRLFCMQRLLDAAATADMLARENSGFSVDASVRITLIDRVVPSYFESLELPNADRWIIGPGSLGPVARAAGRLPESSSRPALPGRQAALGARS